MSWFGNATCSCGCGRPVARADRKAAACARTAGKLVGEMEAMDFANDADEYRRAFLFEGVSWRNQYTRVVHGSLTRDQIRSEAAWREWVGGARVAVRAARRG